MLGARCKMQESSAKIRVSRFRFEIFHLILVKILNNRFQILHYSDGLRGKRVEALFQVGVTFPLKTILLFRCLILKLKYRFAIVFYQIRFRGKGAIHPVDERLETFPLKTNPC